VETNAFSGLFRLRIINLGSNKLTAITVSTFGTDLSELETLDLSGNLLTSVAPDAFDGLPKLKYLYLGGNPGAPFACPADFETRFLQTSGCRGRNPVAVCGSCTFYVDGVSTTMSRDGTCPTQCASGDGWLYIQPSPGLEVRNIANNTFMGLSDVTNLNMVGTALSDIAVETFKGFTGLTYLNLGTNNISRIEPGAFSPVNLPKLRSLSLNGNAMTTVPSNTVSGLPELNYLSLRDNKITDMAPDALNNLPKLTRLDLRSNPLTNILAIDFLQVVENPNLNLELDQSFMMRRLAALEARCPAPASAGPCVATLCWFLVGIAPRTGAGPDIATASNHTRGQNWAKDTRTVSSPTRLVVLVDFLR